MAAVVWRLKPRYDAAQVMADVYKGAVLLEDKAQQEPNGTLPRYGARSVSQLAATASHAVRRGENSARRTNHLR